MIDKNIYTNGTYLKNNPGWNEQDSEWKAAAINKILIKNKIVPAEITELGCGVGGILKILSGEINNKINFYGYDISPQAIELAKKYESENIKFFNEDFISKNIITDTLLVIDVLEHVDDYYGFLEKIKTRSKYFIFHIPLDLSCRMVLKPHILLQQRNAVGHIHYFTKDMVQWFLKDKGYEIIDWFYTKPATDVTKSKSIRQQIKKDLRNIFFAINKDAGARLFGSYSMMILAK